MYFSPLFKKPTQSQISAVPAPPESKIGADSRGSATPESAPICGCPRLSAAIREKIDFRADLWFMPGQLAWLTDEGSLRIWEKSRQVGATTTDAFDSVMKVAYEDARFDVWVSSRDESQAELYLEDCLTWARILHLAAVDLGMVLLDRRNHISAHAIQFANAHIGAPISWRAWEAIGPGRGGPHRGTHLCRRPTIT